LVSWEANIRARGRHVISKQQEGAFYILRSGGPTPHGTQIPSRNHTTLNPPPQIRIRKVRDKEQYPTHSTAQSRYDIFLEKTEEKGKLIEEKKIYISPNQKDQNGKMKQRHASDSASCFHLGAERLLQDDGVAGAGVDGSGGGSGRHGVHLDGCRRGHADMHREQGPSDGTVYRWGKPGKLKNWQRFTFPRPSERPSALRFCAP